MNKSTRKNNQNNKQQKQHPSNKDKQHKIVFSIDLVVCRKSIQRLKLIDVDRFQTGSLVLFRLELVCFFLTTCNFD